MSLSEVTQGFKNAGVSAVEVLPRLLTAVATAAVIGNADQHAKNISILYSPSGARMAPLYDLTSTMIYEDITKRSAFNVGGEIYIDEIDDEACIKEAIAWGMPARQARDTINQLIARLNNACDQAIEESHIEGWHSPVVEQISTLVRTWPQRCRS